MLHTNINSIQEMLDKDITPNELGFVFDEILYEYSFYLSTHSTDNDSLRAKATEHLYWLRTMRNKLFGIAGIRAED